MNALTFVFVVISIIFYVLTIIFIATQPKKVFVWMKKQLLQSLDPKRPGEWMGKKDPNRDWFWNFLQDRAIGVLKHKHGYLSLTIFIQGISFLLCWVILTLPLVYKTGYPINNLIHENVFYLFLGLQIFIFVGFYIWHSLRFKKYLIIGTQEKLIEEIKDHLAEEQNKAENKFLN